MHTFLHDDLSVRHTRTGSGPPLVFLHNGGTSHAIWSDVIPLLSAYECFALDLPGFGESSKPDDGYELDRYVALLGAFVDAHSLSPVTLVGNCMGSATSLAFAMQRPDDVRALVLINTLTTGTFSNGIYGPMLGLPQKAPGIVSVMSKVALGRWMGKFGVRSQLGKHGVARRVHERPELSAVYASSSQSRSLLKVLADVPNYAVLDRFEPPPDFPRICSIWGLENRVLPAKDGRALVRTLRPERQEWLEGCGHLPMLDAPERVATIVREFVESSHGQSGEEASGS